VKGSFQSASPAEISCEVRLLLWNLRQHVALWCRRRFAAGAGLRQSPAWSSQQLLARRRVFLRRLLQEHPRWALGHSRLGLTELELELFRDGAKDLRAIGSMRTSAAAVRTLLADADFRCRALLEADFLDAMREFFARNYVQALQTFEELLRPEHARQLTRPVYASVLEYAGAAAMVLGRAEDAKRWFTKIPVQHRKGEQETALGYLNQLTASAPNLSTGDRK
jgi:hypothetical protein